MRKQVTHIKQKQSVARTKLLSSTKGVYNTLTKLKIESILKSTRTSMEIEGFVISSELEETGRKILMGELDIDTYINQCKQKAMKLRLP